MEFPCALKLQFLPVSVLADEKNCQAKYLQETNADAPLQECQSLREICFLLADVTDMKPSDSIFCYYETAIEIITRNSS